ncbi:facilitated trehalose transporter Tret1-like [Vanessa atalanta]|uniref:facilitated trehalose transporter Tret1-like n=1 Tax=Vanessa atalanta TaxID=42275 RepID=UPI001FCDA72A|nr:facilitated trehalose transporter Tret1-like [Vanessa atalanta]
MARKQTVRQIFVVSGLALCSLSDGFIFGQMSGMLNALHTSDNSVPLTDNDLSWIASTINISCFCGFGVMTALTEIYGRRKSITIMSVPVLICWLMVYFAQDRATLLASRVIVGISYGGILLLTYINIGEYVSPNCRSLTLNMTSCIGSTLGTMLGHILSIILHWRYVALIGMIPTAISGVLPLFWVESPSWLATKKRFQESERAFKALHIPCEASDRELKALLEDQRTGHTMNENDTNSLVLLMKRYYKASKKKYFWKTAGALLVINIYRITAGRILLSTLAITMIQDISGSSDILQYTLVVDGFGLLGACISCIIVSKFKMRSILFVSGVIANLIQIVLAICLYAWLDDGDKAWPKVVLLALYLITVTAGPYSVLETLLSELHPLEIKAINTFIFGAVCGIMQFLNIQYALRMFSSIGYHGVFFLHAILIFLCLIYLFIYLPETKGRTLQEIEFYFKHNTFGKNNSISEKEMEILNRNENYR